MWPHDPIIQRHVTEPQTLSVAPETAHMFTRVPTVVLRDCFVAEATGSLRSHKQPSIRRRP